MEASSLWALGGLVLALFGAVFYAKSTSRVIDLAGQHLALTDESARSARHLAFYGWLCIVAAFGCGVISELVR